MSRKLATRNEDYYAGALGVIPLRWVAPEVVKSALFSSHSDVWSFAVLCAEVLDDGAKVWLFLMCFLNLRGWCINPPFNTQPYAGWTNEQGWVLVVWFGVGGGGCGVVLFFSCIQY